MTTTTDTTTDTTPDAGTAPVPGHREAPVTARTLRRQLAALARGNVLEVAVGTGRNLPYLDWSAIVATDPEQGHVEADRDRMRRLMGREKRGGDDQCPVLSFTGVDISADMLGVARDRLRGTVPGLKQIMRRYRAEAMPALADGSGAGTPVVELLDARLRLLLADAQAISLTKSF